MFTLAAEVPLASGLVASQTYSTVAGAVKATAALNEHWNLKLNAGMANGQSGSTTNKLTAFYFHPDYRPGLLMFNYNFANLATGTGSAYDNAITNSRFFAVSGQLNSGKFSHEWLGLFGFADQTADGVNPYFNTSRGYLVSYSGGGAQSSACLLYTSDAADE